MTANGGGRGDGGRAPAGDPAAGGSFRRALGTFDATMVVVGGIIGAGIFINPYIVAERLPTPGLVLAAWLAGGAVALAGALTFAELGSLFPKAGGHYAYLRDAFHPMVGFLYGWALLLMIEGGAIAAVAIIFAEYTLSALGRVGVAATPLAVTGIVVVAAVNYLGVKPGSHVLNTFVVLKVAAIGVLIAAGLLLPDVDPVFAIVPDEASTGVSGSLWVAFGAALIPVMFSYGGWQNANYVAEEIRDPVRNLPRSLIWGTVIVVTVYGLINYVYLRTLGHGGLAGTLTPAADTARVLFGDGGERLIAVAIAVSTFGFLNLTMLAPTRVYYAMARDGAFFEGVSRLHPRFGSPSAAIVIQSGWAIVLVLTGTYAQLVDYVVFADWIFFGLAGVALFVFRRTHPVEARSERLFRTPLHPLVPGLFVLVSVAIVFSVVRSNPAGSAIGGALLLTGIPVFLIWKGRARR